jgi:hypothetical protein
MAISRKPGKGRRAKPESGLARAKVKSGRSATVSLLPKAAFAGRLAAATRILVKETVKMRARPRSATCGCRSCNRGSPQGLR